MEVILIFFCWFVFSCVFFSLNYSFICFIYRFSHLSLVLYYVLNIASSIMLSVSFVVIMKFLKGFLDHGATWVISCIEGRKNRNDKELKVQIS